MRIVTRPDFDGIVCAALLCGAEKISRPTLWVQPNAMQKGLIPIESTDIIANLPHHPNCALWFDHHITNQPQTDIKGAFSIAPSAARVIFEYYRPRFHRDYTQLVQQTDDIDSANLTGDQIMHPEHYPHVLLSMTIIGRDETEEPYWNRLVELLREHSVEEIVTEPAVARRCRETVKRNAAYQDLLIRHTRLQQHVAITDFRPARSTPDGNRFLVYSLYPESSVSIKIRHTDPEGENTTVSVGRSVLNDTCRVNVGRMLSRYGGGGHAGAGACSFPSVYGEKYISEIIETLKNNQEMED
jgi:oligoribonuclease NrnB/cAMP/cGMP phosphodiesterase (DHH superfamily)